MGRTRQAVAAFVRTHPRISDTAVVAGITVFAGLLSGSEQWAGLDTPDSSFYATLALHGDQVTDRAPETSYYWTRLGYIVPVRVLTSLLGPFPGFAAYRLLLLLLIVAAIYLTVRTFTRLPSSAVLTTMATLSTVVLAYLGNTYLTGSVLAGTAVLIACGVRGSGPSSHWPWALLAGATMGWLAMVNPYGALLGGTIWLVLAARPLHWRMLLGRVGIAAVTGVVVFSGYLLAGRVVFPKMDWLGTYLEWNAKLNYADFASKSPVWLGDVSLLVPLSLAVIVLVVWAMKWRDRAAQTAALIVAATVVVLAAFYPFMGGITLEAPMYQAMLWPPALVAFVVVGSAQTRDRAWSWSSALVAAAGIGAVLACGHWPGILGPGLAIGVAVLITAVGIAGLSGQRLLVVALLATAIVLAGSQLLQNSRRDIGLYYLSPYANAFRSNPVEEKVRAAIDVQEWLLSRTARDDQILLWVGGDWVGGDRELFVVAGMQLWGENRATLEPTLNESDIERLRAIRPSVIAMYAPTKGAVLDFWRSIPGDLDPTAPDCRSFPWPTAGIGEAQACLTALHWPAA